MANSGSVSRILQALTLSIVFLVGSGCSSKTENEGSMEERLTDPEVSSQQRHAFEGCVEKALFAPWKLTSTDSRALSPSVSVTALADDLGIARRTGEYRQQKYVDITFGRLTDYRLLNLDAIDRYIANGDMVQLDRIGKRSTKELLPLEVYAHTAATTIFLNRDQREYCVYQSVPDDWPNPFAKCQVIRDKYSAGLTLPADSLGNIDKVFVDVRKLFDSIEICLDSI